MGKVHQTYQGERTYICTYIGEKGLKEKERWKGEGKGE